MRNLKPPFSFEVPNTREGNLEADETADASVIATLIEEGLILPAEDGTVESLDAEETSEEQREAATEAQDEAEETQEDTGAQDDVQDVEESADALAISLPLAGHTANSLRNLVNMVYSRGALLSKATGGTFACTLEQTDTMKDCLTVADVTERLTDDLRGITIADDRISFTGFPMTDDPEKIRTLTQLAAQMNKTAKEKKRIMAKEVDATNEKYIFRIWLLSLGMGGDEFKTARRVLLAPLSGNAAFKDEAMENRWKEKQAAKKAESRETE